MKRLKLGLAALLLSAGLSTNANAMPVDVDIAFIVDQSGSMSGEFQWIPNVINEIATALASEASVGNTRYGIAGYMRGVGNEFASTPNSGEFTGLAYVDLTGNVATVSTEASNEASDLRCCAELGYHAADWSRTGFSWAVDAVKVMILLTDEPGDQGSIIPDAGPGTKEEDLGKLLADGDFLLNVVTRTRYYNQWDQAVFDQNSAYKGLFDIDTLRTNAEQFTKDFVAAKVGEITGTTPIPIPSTILLIGIGLLGLRLVRKHA